MEVAREARNPKAVLTSVPVVEAVARPLTRFHERLMAEELTAKIVDNYDKYKFCFRDWDPEPAHYAWLDNYFNNIFKGILKAKTLAFLWEDLAWTQMWRKGIDYLKLPTWEEVAKEKYGLEVVYSKPVKARGTMYLPILQEIATKKADVIWFISSWFTDTEVYAKQWADSAARNIPTVLYGGVAQTHDFWRMTGGKGMGCISMFCEGDIPYTEKTLPFIALGKKLGIPLQIHVHIAYADIYHFKAAIEKAGGTDNMDNLIKAMEDVETGYYLRLRALDRPGVLADVTRICADLSISIDAIFQKEAAEGEDQVDVVILTHVAPERNVNEAMRRIEALPTIPVPVVRIRLEELL
jgi:hypothetical protein